MPTSSIFYNFTITDEKEAERFVEALEKASQQPPWKPGIKADSLVRDPEVIREIANRCLERVRRERDMDISDQAKLSDEISETAAEPEDVSVVRNIRNAPQNNGLMDSSDMSKELYEIFTAGREAGVGKAKADIAMRMLEDGLSVDLTAKYTGLCKEEAAFLKRQALSCAPCGDSAREHLEQPDDDPSENNMVKKIKTDNRS